ncbi:unnamed protein product [Vitrella brassicaformis CCMP3155]|uniref:Large ribosomal subunit protein uL24 C-terminal domain-containing protein n=2 Tax=Vitrella brassicaformis TaxID=1169539 RepID=A0A0G4FAJ0_VITBC|nr:unnamed protein product [Vitrella brassicaformis CCMP3155]|eukprot:CEM09911.1 unnamed protein product [Vitrella brassicaformis CCMP3155]
MRWDARGPKMVKPRNIIRHWKIKPGDEVGVIMGKEKGKTGKVLATDALRNQVKVKGCNLRKIFWQNKWIYIEKKIHYSNVLLLDPVLRETTRVALRYTDDGQKVRISKKTGTVIPWPESKRRIINYEDKADGPKDTLPEDALARTYDYKKDVEMMRMIRQTMTKYNRDVR